MQSLRSTSHFRVLFRSSGSGTVGAVVVDKTGRVAMATSTGGLTGKAPGRIGDTPLAGQNNRECTNELY